MHLPVNRVAFIYDGGFLMTVEVWGGGAVRESVQNRITGLFGGRQMN